MGKAAVDEQQNIAKAKVEQAKRERDAARRR